MLIKMYRETRTWLFSKEASESMEKMCANKISECSDPLTTSFFDYVVYLRHSIYTMKQ